MIDINEEVEDWLEENCLFVEHREATHYIGWILGINFEFLIKNYSDEHEKFRKLKDFWEQDIEIVRFHNKIHDPDSLYMDPYRSYEDLINKIKQTSEYQNKINLIERSF